MRVIVSTLHRLRRRPGRSRGQSLVEFGLILPVFLLFFGAVLDLGRIAAAQVTVTNAAREGAFQAAQTPTDHSAGQPCPAGGATNRIVCRTILEANNSVVTIAPADISVTCNPDCSAALGKTVTVRVIGHFTLATPILTAFFGGSPNVTFSAASTQQLEILPPPPTATVQTEAPSASASGSASASASSSPSSSPTSPSCILPSAGFTYTLSPESGKKPVKVNLTDTSTSVACGITSWFWSFGDGTTSLQKDPPQKVYNKEGAYDVTLTVTNAVGSSTTGAVRITVIP